MKKPEPQFYHHYDGRECTARFPIHTDGYGWWITGPILLNDDGKTWDETNADTMVVPRQNTEAKAINVLRRKLGAPPPGASPGEGWGSIEKEKRTATMSLKEMAAKGLLTP